jgi:isopentenyl phosphate kinase
MLVVKLGGSYITYKRGYSSIRFERDETHRSYPVKGNVLAGCAKTLRGYMKGGLIIVHGGGIHGHRTVMRWREGIAKGPQHMMPWEVRRRMDELTAAVVSALGKGGIPAFPVPPGNIMNADSSSISDIDLTPINSVLERGMVPVMRGDIVPDISGGWSVVSGDELIARLGTFSHLSQLPPIERVIMLMEADGFFMDGPYAPESRLSRIDDDMFHARYGEWADVGRNPISDVSGGIIKKICTAHRIAANGISVSLIGGNPTRIDSVMAG